MPFTSPFALAMPIHALTGPRIIRQCYALLTRQRQQQTAHTDAIHYLTNEPGGRPHFCEGQAVRKVPQCCRPTKKKRTPRRACGARRLRAEMHRHCQRPQGAVAPQVAPKDKGMRLGAMPAGLRSKMRWPRRRPQGAVAPQVAPKDKGARLACGARRLRAEMRCYSPLRRKRA